MNNTITSILALTTLALNACTEQDPTVTTPVPTPTLTATATTDAYPLTTCVVSGEPLGTMGEPVVIDHKGTTVKFCCKTCVPKFNATPSPYLAKLKQ